MADLVDLEDLPDPELEPKAAAELYLRLAPLRSWNARATGPLRHYVERNGPIETLQGSLSLSTTGYEYPPEILDAVPDFGRLLVHFDLPINADGERVKELLAEAMPEHANDLNRTWTMMPIVDQKRCKTWASDADMSKSETGKAIRALRRPRQSLSGA